MEDCIDPKERYFTGLEAAEYLGISRELLYELVRSAEIRIIILSPRWRVTQTELDRYKAEVLDCTESG